MSNDIQKMTQAIQDQIREVAYLMWESAGRHQGMAMEYWLAAEKEVLAIMQAAAERMMPAAISESKDRTKATKPQPSAGDEAKTEPAAAAKPAQRKTATRASAKS